ncbi:NapC/NirT family cytochrome c [Campylobacter sp. 19-13652]|uniref:cytochrome c3 family protein n=1 Tax=Campylobacter sp. 19-13652 TaxID=2840180 RepID=UPI001C75C45C|nr:NapC/NirT family cytochrome c [Campylobacter sp. 19-13652]BCX78584.1 hypothetical protein LBC_00460 [Campylobacter sp. 19-13652]
MKKILILGAFLGVLAVWGVSVVVQKTADYPFCGSCHEWDGAIAQTALADDTHGRANAKGVAARCTDCHLPHESLAEYLFVKFKNGLSEGYTTLTGDASKKDWIAGRDKARAKHTYDSACLNCHAGVADRARLERLAGEAGVKDVALAESKSGVKQVALGSEKDRAAAKMHLKYLELKGGADSFKCTDCHKHVGHKELGKMLIKARHKVAESWEEWEQINGVK